MYPWDGLQHGGKNDQVEEGPESGPGLAGGCCNVFFVLLGLGSVLFWVLFCVAPGLLQRIIDFVTGLP